MAIVASLGLLLWAIESYIGWKAAFFAFMAIHLTCWLLFWRRPGSFVPAIPAKNSLPAFYNFRDGEFERIPWTWRWRDGSTEPSPDAIEDLAARCPNCNLRCNARDRRVLDPGSPGQPMVVASFAGYAPRVIGLPACYFLCDHCKHEILCKESCLGLFDKVKRLIERQANAKG